MRRRFLSRLASEVGHHLGADLALGLIVEVFSHGVFQHRLEVAALIPGNFPHRGQQVRRSLAGELFVVQPFVTPRAPLRRPLRTPWRLATTPTKLSPQPLWVPAFSGTTIVGPRSLCVSQDNEGTPSRNLLMGWAAMPAVMPQAPRSTRRRSSSAPHRRGRRPGPGRPAD